MKLVLLPDCSAAPTDLRLSAAQRRAIIAILANEGVAGLDAWLAQEANRDPHIRDRLAARRESLERDAEAMRRRMEEEHAQQERSAETKWERSMRERMEREAQLMGRLGAVDARLSRDDLLRSAVHQAVLAPKRAPWFSRFMARLRRFWIMIVALWVRLIRKARGAPPPRHTITLPDGVVLDLAGIGPDALVALRRTSRSRWRDAWERFTGRADHAEQMARLLEEEQKALEDEARIRAAGEEERLRQELDEERGETAGAKERREEEQRERRRAQEKEMEELVARAESAPLRRLREEIVTDFEEAGMVDSEGQVTQALLSSFASALYEDARRSLPAHGESLPGLYVEGDGEYEMGPLRSSHEMGAMDLATSLVQARIRHPRQRHIYDNDVLVHREVRMAKAHVILVFDTSGSMEAEGRMDAAKRVCLVLHKAVRDRNPDHRVDLLLMNTSIEQVDLAGCWNAEPSGFTNHGAALREARRLFGAGGAEQKLLYVVTDGLPEAYTRPDGTDKADRPEVCMEYALQEARRLRDVPGLKTTIIQLETNDPRFLEAARTIAAEAQGYVEAVDPTELTGWVLGDFAGGS